MGTSAAILSKHHITYELLDGTEDPIDYADEPASKIPDWFTWIITLFVAYVVVMSTLLPMWQNFKGAVHTTVPYHAVPLHVLR